jgi:hypothetical protein
MSNPKKNGVFFQIFFGLIFLLFIGLLIYVWHGTWQANPVILDEKGQVRSAAPDSHHQ